MMLYEQYYSAIVVRFILVDYIFFFLFFFFNDTATTEIYTLSLHDALPICSQPTFARHRSKTRGGEQRLHGLPRDRKSTRLNSSHSQISYAVFCLKKKKNTHINYHMYNDD